MGERMKFAAFLIVLSITMPSLASWSDEKTKVAWELAEKANDAKEARATALEEYQQAPAAKKAEAKLALEQAEKQYQESRKAADQAALNLVKQKN